MKLKKSRHEALAQFFEQPTRERLREIIKTSIGETDYLDCKAEWPDLGCLTHLGQIVSGSTSYSRETRESNLVIEPLTRLLTRKARFGVMLK
jgi:hypothetical protein